MKTVFCVFVECEDGSDVLVWVCSSIAIAQSYIDKYGYNGYDYCIREEILKEVMA